MASHQSEMGKLYQLLPLDDPHQITSFASAAEACRQLGGALYMPENEAKVKELTKLVGSIDEQSGIPFLMGKLRKRSRTPTHQIFKVYDVKTRSGTM